MIFGECPYCDEMISTPIADTCPAMSKETCDSCGKQYWLKHSRLNPVAYPMEEIEVNEETKSVKIKNPEKHI